MEPGISWHRPPGAAEALATIFLPDAAQREAVLGDLAEEYQLVASRAGVPVARRWYWSQVGRSIVPLAIMGVRADGLRFVANVIAGLIAIMTLVPLSFMAASWLAALASGGEYIDGVLALGLYPYAVYSWWGLTGVVAGLGTGYTLARVGGPSGNTAAIALGIVCITLSAFTLAADSAGAPVWYEVVLSAVILPAIVCGIMLHTGGEESNAEAVLRGISS